jgi:hypothetical protein
VTWQDSHARTYVDGRDPLPSDLVPVDLLLPFARTVQTDAGQRLFSFGADGDVAENMKLSLTGSRVTRFNRGFGTQFTETLLSAALQLGFFSGSFH